MPDKVSLCLGPLGGDGLDVRRSGIHWLVADGQLCRPGEMIGFCNLAVLDEGNWQIPGRFERERNSLQLALISPLGGLLRHAGRSSRGGWLDRVPFQIQWQPDRAVASLEVDDEAWSGDRDIPLGLHCLTGSSMTDLVMDAGGLLPGWHDRSRAWRVGNGETGGGVLGLGICELAPVLAGEDGIFLEMLNGVAGPAHAANVWDAPLVHSARVIIEQIGRTRDEGDAIADDFMRLVTDNPGMRSPENWIFGAACVHALQKSPATDRFDLLTGSGIETTQPADAVVLSANAEPALRLRHRKLGYTFNCHDYRLRRMGGGMLEWLKQTFEREPNTLDDTRRDYVELAGLLRQSNPARQLLVLNSMSTLGREDIVSYDMFDAPLGQSLRSVRSRELNAMLDDLSSEAGIAVVDADAIGAELGGAFCIPDGVHQNGEMQLLLRQEILSILSARGVPGFAAKPVS